MQRWLTNKDPDKDPFMSGYALNSEKNAGNGVKSVEHRRRRHRHRQPHGGIPPKLEERHQWQERQDGMDGTNGTNEYRFLESPNHFANFFASHPFFVWTFRVQTLGNVVHATRCERTTDAHFSRAPDTSSTHMRWLKMSVRVCIFSKVILSSHVSSQHRFETSGTAERAVRRKKEGTSAVLLQSVLDENWWADSMECKTNLRNVTDLLSDGKTPYERRFGEPF